MTEKTTIAEGKIRATAKLPDGSEQEFSHYDGSHGGGKMKVELIQGQTVITTSKETTVLPPGTQVKIK